MSWLLSIKERLLERFLPFLVWLPELKNPTILKADMMAGLTVALIAVPQSMAYAKLAGLPAQMGLYASFLPVMAAALFGSSRQLSTGPVAMASLMSGAALQSILGATPDVNTLITYSAFLALMIGVFRLSFGLLGLGVLVDFLSHPVVTGFTNAGAIIIATSQIGSLLGISAPPMERQYETVWELLKRIPDLNPVTFAMGLFSLFSLIILKKFAPRLPNVLITVVLCTGLSALVGYDSLGGKVVGKIESGLPSLIMPSINVNDMAALLGAALIIAVFGFVEAVSISKAIASQTRHRFSANQELVGQGLGNIIAGLFQGYVVSGSFSRSAVNYAAGAKTGFASMFTGLLVALTLLLFVDFLYYIPDATLSAVIMMAVFNLIKIEPIKHAWKVTPHDGVVAIVTFLAAVFFAPHLERGIMIGVLLSLGLFLYHTMSPHFVEVARHADGTLRDAEAHHLKTSETLAIYRFDGMLYFGNSGYCEGKMLNNIAKKSKLKVVILDIEATDQVDSTGEEMLRRMADRMRSAGIDFYIARAKLHVYEAFERSGLAKHIGAERFFRSRTAAAQYAKKQWGDAVDIEPIMHVIPVW